MVYPRNFEQKIGFDQIRLRLRERCVTEAAREKVQQMAMTSDADRLHFSLSRVSQMQLILLCDTSFPEVNYIDVQPFMAKLRVEGAYLEEHEFYALGRALRSAEELLSYFARVKQVEGKSIDAFEGELNTLTKVPHVLQAMESVIDDKAQVRDSASKLLHEIRRKIKEKESGRQTRLQSILKKAQVEGWVEEGVELSVREGRLMLPVAAGSKRKIKGLVYDESATGKTVYIEPLEIIELNNAIKELEAQERREIVRLLVELTASIRPDQYEIGGLTDFLIEIDFTRAKALQSISMQACYPYMHPEPYVDWKKARHPILQASLRKEKREIVPLDVKLSAEKHLLIISGPNAGGKSVCLKTVGLLQYMLQCGLPIPVSELSEVGIFERIFIDIGDEQSLENDLSTYSSHLQNMKQCLRDAHARSLVLIDEFGTGTEPTAGGAIAEAVLSEFVDKHVFGVITTHYANLKYFAATHEGVINGAMLFDEREIKPLFKLELGYPGSSFALEIARKTGLPESVLAVAQAKMGTQYVGLEKQLREVAKNRRVWEEKKQRIQKADAHVEQLENKYKQELEQLQQERKQILKQAQRQAAELVKAANRKIEQTIREIREAEADRTKTKEIRQSLQQFEQSLPSAPVAQTDGAFSDQKILDKMNTVQARQQRRAERKAQSMERDKVQTEPKLEDKPMLEWKVGAKVKLKGQQAVGEIVKQNGNKYVVAFGTLLSSVSQEQVQLLTAGEYKKNMRETAGDTSRSRFDLGGRRLNFKPTLDVRGDRASEALVRVETYLDEAVMLGMREVSILHGTGSGILKEQIRNILKALPYVAEYKDERVELGGAGITLVTLNS